MPTMMGSKRKHIGISCETFEEESKDCGEIR